MMAGRLHGGPDHQGAARHDFSTCANPLGPCPLVVEALAGLDVSRYPDPASTASRERLAACHGVAPARILMAVSASEFIQRMTAAAVRLLGPRIAVEVPAQGYGDYAAAATAWGLPVRPRREGVPADRGDRDDQGDPSDSADPGGPGDLGDLGDLGEEGEPAPLTGLHWWAEPSSPRGLDAGPPHGFAPAPAVTVLDAVYAPLRLQGASAWRPEDRDAAFVLHGPNKALGLCGLRGAYAVAPLGADAGDWVATLAALTPSWPLSVAGVQMLDVWARPEGRRWVEAGRPTLVQWRADLEQVLVRHGFEVAASVSTFLCARPPRAFDAGHLRAALRARDIAVRDAASFGLPGWWRLSAQPPGSLAALDDALAALLAAPPGGQPALPRR